MIPCLSIFPFLAGCRKKPVVAQPMGPFLPQPVPPPSYQPHGLSLSLQADPELNPFERTPHALLAVLYQLSATNAFNTLAKDPAGLRTLLQGLPFDPSVASADKLFLQPGERRTLPLDRAQNGRWLAVVAGYYGLAPGAVTRILELPAGNQDGRACVLDLRFGRDSIQDLSFSSHGEGR
ncbi:MAG: type VI secretion lipoprotein TssJ [Holophaga sp.]|nr:type VI secretion lipoprotein TssJ [Holophaga sp.]